MDKTQLNLSTGKKVNSPLDNAVSFFTAKSLTDRASDLNSLLDAMGQSISGLNQASTSATSLTKLVEQANSIANQARDALAKGTAEAKVAGEANLSGKTDLTKLSGVVSGESQLTFTILDKDGKAIDFDVLDGQSDVDNPATITVGGANNPLSIDNLVTKINGLDDKAAAPVLEAKLNDKGQLEIKALDGGSFSLKFVGNNGTPSTPADLVFCSHRKIPKRG